MSPTSVIGPLFDAGELEEAVKASLEARLPAYLAEARAQKDYGSIAAVRSWGVVSDFARFPEQGLPAIIIASPGTTDKPVRGGDGSYSATWALSVIAEVQASTGADARRVAQIYGAAIRGAMLQRRSLGEDFVVDWAGNDSTTLDVAQRRTRVAVEELFTVQVDDIVNWRGGLPTEDTDYTHPEVDPEAEIPEEWDTVESHDVDVQPIEELEE